MTLSTLVWFVSSSVVFTMAPGPDTTFVVAQGISRGRKAAVTTALGMCSGVSVHTTAAALGISALVRSCASLFMVLKWAGGAYLLFLAWKAIREPAAARFSPTAAAMPSQGAMFRRGFIMNVINPKVALFFLAFLPQFVSRDHGGIPMQMFLLGLIFMVQAIFVMSTIGFLSGSVGDLLLKKPAIAKYFTWLSAGIFAALGLKLVFAER